MKQFFLTITIVLMLLAVVYGLLFHTDIKKMIHSGSDSDQPHILLTQNEDIGITIDDLPAAGPTPTFTTRTEVAQKIIHTLKRYDVPDPYGFSIGNLIVHQQEREKIMQMWHDAGYPIGNHTYTHQDLSEIDAQKYNDDIAFNESSLTDYARTIKELKVFRYPYLSEGETKEKRYTVREYLLKRKYKIAQVTIDTFDWDFNAAYVRCMDKGNKKEAHHVGMAMINSLETNLDYYKKLGKFLYGYKKHVPQILLLHFNPITADYLDDMIDAILKNGFTLRSSIEEMNDPILQEDPGVISKVGLSFYEQILVSRKLNFTQVRKRKHNLKALEHLCQ